MFFLLGRAAADVSLRSKLCVGVLCCFLFAAASARAVVVRGRVTDPLGAAVPGARVQLVEAGKSVADAVCGRDGRFEIRNSSAGRFTLLTSAGGFLPAVGDDFYGGAGEVLTQDVVIAANTVHQQVSVTATGVATPLPQLTAPVSVLTGDLFETRTGIVAEMRQTPGAFLVQSGQTGSVTSLFMRGGNSTANLVLVDGVPAIDVGGVFDYGTVSSTGVGRMELYRGPNSAAYGTDAGAAVMTIDTPRGVALRPLLTYSGDAGNLHTWRNEVTLGGVRQKLDYFGGFSRFDTSNALPNDRYHAGTAVANLGYAFNGNTQLRFTLRNGDSVEGVPGPYNFQGKAVAGREADQNLFSGATLENTRRSGWHNLVRYGIARKREQAAQYYPASGLGSTVTLHGANGYTATGTAQIFGGNTYDQASYRDQLYFQSDYSWSPRLIGLFGFRYDKERGSYNDYLPAYSYTVHQKVQRTNFEYNAQFQGQLWSRLNYSLGGAVEKNHLYGIAGTPKLGLSYVAVRPGTGWFRGTRVRGNAATGVQEPTLALEFSSLYHQLQAAGDMATIAKYGIGPDSAQRSRTYDLGFDQNVWAETVVLHAAFFHNVFDRQLEGVPASQIPRAIQNPVTIPSGDFIFSAYVNSLAYRAQGAEAQVEWRPRNRFFATGGYTYLATNVLQSFASDAVKANNGTPTTNPNIPGVAIGATSPLVGARVFRRAPHTGFVSVQYTAPAWTIAVKAALASRSDDSTFLGGSDANYGNTLLLPNRDLDFAYAKVDLSGTYAVNKRLTVFTQLENLTNDQHIGPIGYPSLPLTVRGGLKVRLGGDE